MAVAGLSSLAQIDEAIASHTMAGINLLATKFKTVPIFVTIGHVRIVVSARDAAAISTIGPGIDTGGKYIRKL